MKGPQTLAAVFMSAVICFLSMPSACGQSGTENPATRQETKWTAEDMIAAESAEQFVISPDGQWVVWVKSVPDSDKDEVVSNLYLSSLREKQEIQLTRGPNTDERAQSTKRGSW